MPRREVAALPDLEITTRTATAIVIQIATIAPRRIEDPRGEWTKTTIGARNPSVLPVRGSVRLPEAGTIRTHRLRMEEEEGPAVVPRGEVRLVPEPGRAAAVTVARLPPTTMADTGRPAIRRPASRQADAADIPLPSTAATTVVAPPINLAVRAFTNLPTAPVERTPPNEYPPPAASEMEAPIPTIEIGTDAAAAKTTTTRIIPFVTTTTAPK